MTREEKETKILTLLHANTKKGDSLRDVVEDLIPRLDDNDLDDFYEAIKIELIKKFFDAKQPILVMAKRFVIQIGDENPDTLLDFIK